MWGRRKPREEPRTRRRAAERGVARGPHRGGGAHRRRRRAARRRAGAARILNEALDPLFAEIPADIDLFDRGICQGEMPRLWIDAVAHVVMGRDKRIYRFVQDTPLRPQGAGGIDPERRDRRGGDALCRAPHDRARAGDGRCDAARCSPASARPTCRIERRERWRIAAARFVLRHAVAASRLIAALFVVGGASGWPDSAACRTVITRTCACFDRCRSHAADRATARRATARSARRAGRPRSGRDCSRRDRGPCRRPPRPTARRSPARGRCGPSMSVERPHVIVAVDHELGAGGRDRVAKRRGIDEPLEAGFRRDVRRMMDEDDAEALGLVREQRRQPRDLVACRAGRSPGTAGRHRGRNADQRHRSAVRRKGKGLSPEVGAAHADVGANGVSRTARRGART